MTVTDVSTAQGLTGLDDRADAIKLIFGDGRTLEGRIEAVDPSGRVVARAGMDDVMSAIPCFTPGCSLLADSGPRRIEDLSVGDRVVTRDNGLRPIRWIGQRRFDWRALGLNPLLRPVVVRAGALGGGLPERDLILSPNHRILFSVRNAAGGREEAFVPAHGLKGRPGVSVVSAATVTYVQVLFDRHEAVMSEGLWSESFQPDDRSIAALGAAGSAEVRGVLGTPATGAIDGYPPARPPASGRSVTELAV
jgi:hypothetical protein